MSPSRVQFPDLRLHHTARYCVQTENRSDFHNRRRHKYLLRRYRVI